MAATAEAERLDLVRLGSAAFTTTLDADKINDSFMERLGVSTRNVVARLAIARSLAVDSPPPAVSQSDERGRTIKGENLFGDDLRTWVALIVEHEPAKNADINYMQDMVRRHWRRGIELLESDWSHCGDDLDKFLLHLAGQAGLKSGGAKYQGLGATPLALALRAVPVRVPIGDVSIDLESREQVDWTINAAGRSPHIAVMGTLGTGKTRAAMSMVRAIHQQAACPLLVFDMGKGDLSADRDLASSLGAQVIEPIRTSIPLDVLHVSPDEPSGIVNAAMRFRESFIRVPKDRIGGAQQDVLREAALRALKGTSPVRLRDVRDRLREIYAERKKKDDVVSSLFNDMMSWTLFEPTMKPADFFARSWIIDVHSAPETAQRLIVFLLLDALYSHLTMSKETPLDPAGHRALRIVLAIDEARKVLAYSQPSLIGLVRESRSKGGAVILISQSPDDFDQVEEDFLENIGLGVSFRTNARNSNLTRVLGQAVDLGQLPDGVCVTRLVDRGLVRIQSWQPKH